MSRALVFPVRPDEAFSNDGSGRDGNTALLSIEPFDELRVFDMEQRARIDLGGSTPSVPSASSALKSFCGYLSA